MKILLLLALISSNVFAWGPEGHKIVGEIAEHRLTPKAKAAVSKLLPGQSFADVANWADVVRGKPEWKQSEPWHFVDIPDGQSYETISKVPGGDAITAITAMVAALKSPTATKISKQDALKFLIHFVGDIHQPLHVGRPTDRGGNMIKVVFEGRATNLHALWDSGMINKEGMDYVAYARSLEISMYLANTYDLPEISFSQIVKEDMSSRSEIYKFREIGSDAVILDATYLNRNLSLMNSHLLMGGKRLADILNRIYQ